MNCMPFSDIGHTKRGPGLEMKTMFSFGPFFLAWGTSEFEIKVLSRQSDIQVSSLGEKSESEM